MGPHTYTNAIAPCYHLLLSPPAINSNTYAWEHNVTPNRFENQNPPLFHRDTPTSRTRTHQFPPRENQIPNIDKCHKPDRKFRRFEIFLVCSLPSPQSHTPGYLRAAGASSIELDSRIEMTDHRLTRIRIASAVHHCTHKSTAPP